MSCATVLWALLAPRALQAASFDWNNIVVGGQSYSFATPVETQIQDTCYAYATVAALESQYMITRGEPISALDPFTINFSELMLINSGAAGDFSGGYMDLAMNYLVGTGVVTNTTYTLSGTSGPVCQATSCLNDISSSLATIKADLTTYGPMVMEVTVPNDWYGTYASSGTGGARRLGHRLPGRSLGSRRRILHRQELLGHQLVQRQPGPGLRRDRLCDRARRPWQPFA